jgi:hypothetical protein
MFKWIKSFFGGKKEKVGLPDDLILNELPPINNSVMNDKIQQIENSSATENIISIVEELSLRRKKDLAMNVVKQNKPPRRSSKKKQEKKKRWKKN